jgi:transcriptional regulator with XRE-family HTH domain
MGSIMRKARESKGLTQAGLAEIIGVSNRTIVAIEKDKRNPTYDVLYRLVHALDIPADLIFFPDENAHTAEQEQFVREFMSCDKREQGIVMTTLRSLIKALKHNGT